MTMTLEQLAEWESHFLQDAIDMEDGLGGNRDRWATHLRVAASIASSCISQPQPVAQGKAVGGEFDMRYDAGFEDGWHKAKKRFSTPTIPTGHRVVPVEWTPAMRDAWNAACNHSDGGAKSWFVAKAYRAMLAAAPDAGGV
jgi:hypothetical protein